MKISQLVLPLVSARFDLGGFVEKPEQGLQCPPKVYMFEVDLYRWNWFAGDSINADEQADKPGKRPFSRSKFQMLENVLQETGSSSIDLRAKQLSKVLHFWMLRHKVSHKNEAEVLQWVLQSMPSKEMQSSRWVHLRDNLKVLPRLVQQVHNAFQLISDIPGRSK